MRKLLLGLIVLLSIFAFPGVTLADTMQTAANLTDLQSLIYQDMVDRETPFEIKYTGDVQTLENGNLMSTMNKASTQDDYLALSFSDIQYNANVISKYDTVLTFTVSYITTKAEEDFVTSQAQSIVSSIITPGMTPDEKEKAIHDYITSHVSYDYSLQYHSAYDALTYGRAVCQGYAMLMEKMLNDAGIKTIIIKGYLNGNQPEDFHAWNMVQLNGFWYQVDATNDGVLNNLFYNVTDIFLSQHGFTWDKTKFPQAATLYSSSGSVIGIALSKTMDTIAVGSNDTLVTTITPSNATNQAVTWKSSNPSVATVDQNGKVLAINGGTATITVTTQDGNKSASCHVTVPNSATNIALSPASTTIDVGFTKSLSVVFRPSATTDKKVTWSSDNTSVAAVDTNGNVKGIADGSANITAKSDDGGFVATCAVTVQTGVTKIVLSKTTDTINVGNNDTLVAAITPSNATSQAVTWKSSNPSVATVDQNGKVVAVKTGTTVISVAAQDGNKVASCQVTVPNLASSIALNLTSTTIDVGFTQSLNVVFTPSNTTDKKVTWSSDNTSVATVDAYGRVKGIALGSANITAKSDDGGLSAACAVTVQTGVTKIVLSKTTDTINVGNNDTLVAAITPGNATNQAVTWKSSNPSVATVDQNGKVVAVKTGTTVISVATQDGNKVASCQVTVPNLAKGISVNPDITTVNIGVTKTLSVTFRPSDTTDKKVTWSSDNPSVATVDAYGRVKGIAEGSANITATSEDGGFTSTCALLVQTGVTKITLNKTSDIVKVGNSDTLVATITPSDATNQNFTWKSSNPSVATVDTNGNVTAIKPGRAVITVTSEDGNKTASCSVTVIYLS